MEEKIKIGLAAFGMSGQVFHAPFIATHPDFELTAIVERSKNLSKERYPSARIIRSYDELLAIPEIELVVVNTPDALHYEYSKRALEAGKNVVVEKPMTQTTAQAEELIALAEKKKLMYCVFQNRRWDADFQTVKDILDKGLVGTPVEFESVFARFRNYVQPDNWKERDGGMVYNLGSHLIDQSLVLFGMPKAVFADVATLRENGMVDDYFCIHLLESSKAPNVHITLKASYLMRESEPRFVLHGTQGSYVKYGVDKQEALLKKGIIPDTKDWGIETEDEWGFLNIDADENSSRKKYPSLRGDYHGFYDAVYKHLCCGEIIETDAKSVLPVIKIIEAAHESSRTKQIVKL